MRKVNLTMTHDQSTDVCYIYLYKGNGDVLKPERVKLTTEKFNDNILLDFTEDGKLFGIEILNAEEQLTVL